MNAPAIMVGGAYGTGGISVALTYADFDLDGVRRVIANLQGSEFTSQDVLQNPRVRAMHAHNIHTSRDDYTYRQMVGKYIKLHEADLDVEWVRYGNNNLGSLWRKRGYEPRR